MKLRSIAFIGITTASMAFAQERRGDDFTEKYGVLNEKNMFLRDRPRPRPVNQRNQSTQPRTNRTEDESPESRLVLRGVVIEDNELRAYFENTRGSSFVKVVPGDTIARGRVSDIAIDAVEYEYEGNRTWIEIGHNLSGARGAAVASAPSVSPSPTVPTTAPSGDAASTGAVAPAGTAAPAGAVDPATLSVEERMRLRSRNRQ